MFNQEVLFNLNFKEKWQEYLMGLFLFIGIGFIFCGLWMVANGPKEESKVVLNPIIETTRGEIIVEIAGAIENPGTYALGEGSRVSDLVRKAGGFSRNVDRRQLASELNLAQKLSDEEKVYIKFLGESSVQNISESIADSGNALISINSASQSQLEELVGVGEKRALEIILQRPYKSIDELVSKSVVSQSIIENNKERLKL